MRNDALRLDFSPLLVPNKPNFELVASSELEASLMVWDLYAYIKELENALNACVEMRK